MKAYNKNKGFTIVELIVVMAILAILILIAVPNLTKYLDDANTTADSGTANTLYKGTMSSCVYESTTEESKGQLQPGKINSNVPLVESILMSTTLDPSSITVYGYNATSQNFLEENNGNWQIYIPLQENSDSNYSVSQDVGDIYISSPHTQTYLNGELIN